MFGRLKAARGFTLIEMAIVMVVIGLLLSGGLLAVAPVLQSSKTTDTNAKMDRIEQALVLHVIRYGCLPCPADPTRPSNDANAGQAFGTPTYYTGSCTTACKAAVTTQGVVPWVNLGLSEADVTDGFGYLIDYAVDTGDNLEATNGMVRTPPATYPLSGSGLVVQKTTTNASVNVTSTAAYVLISHGIDHSLGYNPAGKQTPDPHAPDADQTNNSDGTPFVQDDFIQATPATYFDDIVRFRGAPLVIQLCGSNACGNPA